MPVKRHKILLYFFVMIIIASCQAPRGATVTPAASSTKLPTSTKILATPTQTQPTATLTATTLPTGVAVPALFERSEQELGMRETVQAALGDLDGDGDPDAIFANPMQSYSAVWFNDGSGRLIDSGQQLTQYGHGVGIADFDSDGDLDALIACHQFITGSKIYLNDGSGILMDSGQNLDDAKLSGVEVNLIDLNGDRFMDAHVAYYDPAGVPDRVYLNDGKAQFHDSGLTLDEDTIAWGDVDQDGDVDYFGKINGSGYVVMLNDGRGAFVEGWSMADHEATVGGIALGDFDRDGDMDVLVTNGYRATGSFPSRLLWNNGDGSFTDSLQILNGTSGAELGTGDLDLDGDLDVFVANMDRPNEVWFNEDGQLIDSGLRLGESNELSGRPTLGDLDGDGDLDLVVGRFQGGAEIWFNGTIGDQAAEGLIVFYSERDGDAEIYLMNADGSNQHALTDNEADDLSPAFSPDGSMIVFESDRDDPHPRQCFPDCNYNLYVMNVDGSEQHQLTALPGAEWHADWSPDGKSLIFTAGDIGFEKAGIYRISLEGGEPLPLLVDDFNNDAADWSPDGSQITFSSNRDGNRDIFVMNADGTGVSKVVDTGMDDYFPDWSPDGEKITFFATNWPTTKQDIFTVNADGSDLVNLNLTPQIVDEDPKWSPDGSKIIFQSDRDGDFEIYVMNPDGSQPENLTNDKGRDYVPDWWMPEINQASAGLSDKKIAFVSVRDGNGEIYIMDSDGGNPQRLTNNHTWDGFPGWSPDGKRIAYYSYLSAQSWVIMVMNADGTAPQQLTHGGSCDGAPFWSPDGLWIGFSVDATCDASRRQIAVIDISGQNYRIISDGEADYVGFAWSADGRQILLSSDRDGDQEIYLINNDGSNLIQLTDNEFDDQMPAWSPDGQWITFVSDRDGNDEIYIMNADGSNQARLTDEPADDWFPTWSSDGKQVLFNSWRHAGDLEVYVMNRDGSGVRQLTDSQGEDFNAVWQP